MEFEWTATICILSVLLFLLLPPQKNPAADRARARPSACLAAGGQDVSLSRLLASSATSPSKLSETKPWQWGSRGRDPSRDGCKLSPSSYSYITGTVILTIPLEFPHPNSTENDSDTKRKKA
ncbi:hypothetical protein C7212DRAFT_364404 [Tuber magnatum]|uniref:Uncharacterized protein n=1 Tax=Tuber magnatum TaxID=42249 RepID=A0A317SVB0_9PEZI|nr:hypothetical protein C7212DRAFT_364404 [Tuber magnatum]